VVYYVPIWGERLQTFTATLLIMHRFDVKDYRPLLPRCLLCTDLRWKFTDLDS
jgi:hypothetical protein